MKTHLPFGFEQQVVLLLALVVYLWIRMNFVVLAAVVGWFWWIQMNPVVLGVGCRRGSSCRLGLVRFTPQCYTQLSPSLPPYPPLSSINLLIQYFYIHFHPLWGLTPVDFLGSMTNIYSTSSVFLIRVFWLGFFHRLGFSYFQLVLHFSQRIVYI